MKYALPALLLFAAAHLVRLEPFRAAPGEPAAHCTRDRAWCAAVANQAASGGGELHLYKGRPAGGPAPLATLPLPGDGSELKTGVWDRVARLPDGGLLLGLVEQSTRGYSGGGATSSELRLYRLSPSAGAWTPRKVADLQFSGSLMIRACFDEDDMKARIGACHDEYSFEATLTAGKGVSDAMPDLILETVATAYPADASLDSDSTTRPPLKRRDLVRKRDPKCSYRRTLRFDAREGEYVPDADFPDCDAYRLQ